MIYKNEVHVCACCLQVHQLFKESGSKLVDGYAPFCKHVFVPNFVGAKVGALEVCEPTALFDWLVFLFTIVQLLGLPSHGHFFARVLYVNVC